MSDFNPQSCRILKAELTRFDQNSRDILPLITEVHLSQSVDSVSWKGTVTVQDTAGLLDKFPLRGEEEFRLELQADDLGTVRRLDAQIFRISDISPLPNTNGAQYVLHFLSKLTWRAAKRKVIKPFNNVTAAFAVEKIFKEYFSDIAPAKGTNQNENKEVLAFDTKKYELKRNQGRAFYLQPSIGQIKAVIPNYTPQRALSFLSARAYSSNSLSSSYRFFETLTGYYFVTDEFLMKRGADNPRMVSKMVYGSDVTKEGDDPLGQISSIQTMTDNVRVDASVDMGSGGYKNKSIEINMLERTVKEILHDYTALGDYTTSDGKKRKITDDIHTKEYMDETFTEENAPRFIVFKDYRDASNANPGVLRGDQYYSQSYANRLSHSHHMRATQLSATTSGRLDIEPGAIINVLANSFDAESNQTLNEKLSGNYLVLSTSHDIVGSQLSTGMVMVKYG